ncbi:MAG: hypothetical protein EA426_16205 [Spirochaetaceae bacterium]|nr:MAG: hypothetical protein EA426_16205 [Spirochaetaceae bacterium]
MKKKNTGGDSIADTHPTDGRVSTKKTSAAAREAYIRKLFYLLGAIAVLLAALIAVLPRADKDSVTDLETQEPTEVSSQRTPGSVSEPQSEPTAPDSRPPETAPSPTRLPTPVPEPMPAPVPRDIPSSAVRSVPDAAPWKLAVVIDDAGYTRDQLEPFLSFPGVLTIAVLPQLPHSEYASRAARSAGMDVILHQPMEALNGADPGPGAIFVGDSREDIDRVVSQNLRTVPDAIGVNNHMGSRVTSDRTTMAKFLDVVRDRDLFFLDSRTTHETVGTEVAVEIGVRVRERGVFLDHDPRPLAIRTAFLEALERAVYDGEVIMIGHVMVPAVAELLHEMHDDLIEAGFEFVGLKQLYEEDVR